MSEDDVGKYILKFVGFIFLLVFLAGALQIITNADFKNKCIDSGQQVQFDEHNYAYICVK